MKYSSTAFYRCTQVHDLAVKQMVLTPYRLNRQERKEIICLKAGRVFHIEIQIGPGYINIADFNSDNQSPLKFYTLFGVCIYFILLLNTY